jgi:tetratricopeptide (TPR) repeat protein
MSADPAALIAAMIQRTSLADVPAQQALDDLGLWIDAAGDVDHRQGLQHALTLVATVRIACPPALVPVLDYYEGNVWSCLRRLNHREGQDPWDWRQPELVQEVICFRRALKDGARLPLERQLPVLTNLGNIMSHLGRHVEAIAYYDRAMTLYPKYSMTLGNRGQAFTYYSQYHYDRGHKYVFLGRARDDFTEALKYRAEPGAHDGFRARLAEFDRRKLTSHLADFDLVNHSLGRDEAEKTFRQWALQKRLFLNPLNDLGPYAIASRDVLQLPTIVTGINQGTTFHGFFNQLKQEYASARWFYYEAVTVQGTQAEIDDIADRELMLVDAQDCARLGLQLEKLKIAFRVAYSLLDKIAFFLNAYLDLGLDLTRVNFRSVWFQGANPKGQQLHPKLPKENLPLRGLYWLSRDFVDSNPGFASALEPDAQAIATVRNHLEHRFLRISEMGTQQIWKEDIGYDLSPETLRDRTLQLLRSTRAALIYLVLGINAYEALNQPKPKGPYISEQLPPRPPDDLPLFY